MNPETHTCDCGFTWRHGHSGAHSCGPYYRQTIAELRAAAAAPQAVGDGVQDDTAAIQALVNRFSVPKVVADEREFPEMTDDLIFQWAEGYVFTLKGMPHKMTFSRPRFVEAVRTIIAHLPAAAPVQAQELSEEIKSMIDEQDANENAETNYCAPVQPVAVPGILTDEKLVRAAYEIFGIVADDTEIMEFVKFVRAAPAAQGDAEAIRQAAFKEAIDACYKATPDRAKVRHIGEAAHYSACADAIRAIATKAAS